jgi:hypothetical protein
MASELPFLTAQWRHLAMVNFEIDPGVRFLFVDTRVHGCAIPYHRDFEEVNLR